MNTEKTNLENEKPALSKGAVMYQFIFYFFSLAFNQLHNLTKIILKLFA